MRWGRHRQRHCRRVCNSSWPIFQHDKIYHHVSFSRPKLPLHGTRWCTVRFGPTSRPLIYCPTFMSIDGPRRAMMLPWNTPRCKNPNDFQIGKWWGWEESQWHTSWLSMISPHNYPRHGFDYGSAQAKIRTSAGSQQVVSTRTNGVGPSYVPSGVTSYWCRTSVPDWDRPVSQALRLSTAFCSSKIEGCLQPLW